MAARENPFGGLANGWGFQLDEGDISEPGPGQAVGETLLYRLIPTNGIGGGMVLNSPETFAMEEPYLGSLGAGTRLFVRETSFLIPRAGSSMG